MLRKQTDVAVKNTVRFIYSLLIYLSFNLYVNATMQDSNRSPDAIRVATFNIGLDQAKQRGELAQLLSKGDYPAALKSAEIIQRVAPDILLLNEIDGNDQGKTLQIYLDLYLKRGHANLQDLEYPYIYQPECNTGVSAGINFRGSEQRPDKFGFGHYDGQYCMALLSKFPILESQIQTFQRFLWKDLPGALLPQLDGKAWYSDEGIKQFRLSSKTHADIPVKIHGKVVHALISHPTPPVFDGEEDRNGRRNFDEIKFWQHYVNGDLNWLYNDNGVPSSGLKGNDRFVILGDLNASTVEGDATEINGKRAITELLHNPKVAPGFSERQVAQHIPQRTCDVPHNAQSQWCRYHTAAWKMRADYVIPSAFGLNIHNAGVFWPAADSELATLVSEDERGVSSSDHRLVWLDVTVR